jgi:hypothetical protein
VLSEIIRIVRWPLIRPASRLDLVTTDDGTSAHSGPQQRRYEIWVRGHLGETMRSAFPALRAQPRGEDTVLTGAMADQAELYGVIAEIEALGLELLEVRRDDQR